MKSNNYYLKQIAMALGMSEPSAHKNDLYYLREIAERSEEISDESIKEDLLA